MATFTAPATGRAISPGAVVAVTTYATYQLKKTATPGITNLR